MAADRPLPGGHGGALARLRRALLLGLPLMLVLAAAGGLFLAGRALAPIDQMATAAERITGSDLSGRMGPQGSEELGRLAAAFDRMLERLEQAFRRERRFVSDVSHELRTPLTALRGRIEVTLTRPRSRSEYEDTLRSLETEVERLTRLSEDLLLLARFDRAPSRRGGSASISASCSRQWPSRSGRWPRRAVSCWRSDWSQASS